MGGGLRCHREAHHEDWIGVSEHGAVVHLCGKSLGHTHAVTDKVEYVFRDSGSADTCHGA